MKLWHVEHFWTLFVFTFRRDCYCIQQSRPKMKTKSVQKCSMCQSFTFPKWHSFKIGTLEQFFVKEGQNNFVNKIPFVLSEKATNKVSRENSEI